MISDLSSSPEATADDREITVATMNSVEAKEESRRRGDSMIGLAEKVPTKKGRSLLLCAWLGVRVS